ncbi:MAG TPA: hypothetical protein ENK29_04190, partial [Chromatiales bacterium]|nr:hypothetical protein [Chromatiales bacterium]
MNIKCDGNHGGPRCGDPGCWNDDPRELENEVRLLHDRLNAITMWAINAAQALQDVVDEMVESHGGEIKEDDIDEA